MSLDVGQLMRTAFAREYLVFLDSETGKIVDPVDARRRLMNKIDPVYSALNRICGSLNEIRKLLGPQSVAQISDFVNVDNNTLNKEIRDFLERRASYDAKILAKMEIPAKPKTSTKTYRKKGPGLVNFLKERITEVASESKVLDITKMKIAPEGAVTGTRKMDRPTEKTKKIWFTTDKFPLYVGISLTPTKEEADEAYANIYAAIDALGFKQEGHQQYGTWLRVFTLV